MDKQVVVRLHSSFEEMVRQHTETGVEFWCARDLQMLLGYAKWEKFAKVIEKAKTACSASGNDIGDHFLDIRKMVDVGSGAKREIEDIAITRYACYLKAVRMARSVSNKVTGASTCSVIPADSGRDSGCGQTRLPTASSWSLAY